LRAKDLYGDQYNGVDINVFGDSQSHLLWEKMGDFCYLHEWRNDGRDMAGFKLGIRFLKEHNNVVCSTLKQKIVTVAKRYGFKEYKKIGNRTFMIRS